MKLNNFKKNLFNIFFFNNHGSVLVITILVIGIVLFLAIAFSSLMVMELRFTNLVDNSLAAQYAAEVGIERGILEVSKETALPIGPINGNLANDSSYEFSVIDDDPKAIIVSTGTKDEIRRKFVVEVTKDVTAEPNEDNTYKPFWREVNP